MADGDVSDQRALWRRRWILNIDGYYFVNASLLLSYFVLRVWFSHHSNLVFSKLNSKDDLWPRVRSSPCERRSGDLRAPFD